MTPLRPLFPAGHWLVNSAETPLEHRVQPTIASSTSGFLQTIKA